MLILSIETIAAFIGTVLMILVGTTILIGACAGLIITFCVINIVQDIFRLILERIKDFKKK